MRIGININVCVTLIDNDTCEVSIRHEEGPNRDKEVVKLDLPYEAEFIANITDDAFRAILFDLLLRSEESIRSSAGVMDILKEKREQAKREDDARDEAEKRGEVWACPFCEMVNVADESCARCDRKRTGHEA